MPRLFLRRATADPLHPALNLRHRNRRNRPTMEDQIAESVLLLDRSMHPLMLLHPFQMLDRPPRLHPKFRLPPTLQWLLMPERKFRLPTALLLDPSSLHLLLQPPTPQSSLRNLNPPNHPVLMLPLQMLDHLPRLHPNFRLPPTLQQSLQVSKQFPA